MDLSSIIEAMQSRTVLVLGAFVLDRHSYGDASAISPEAPVPVLRLRDEILRAGQAGHVAAALAALGAKVHCAGAIGDDDSGKRLCELLGRVGVDTTHLLPVCHRPTTMHTRLIGLAQHRHPQQMMRVEEACRDPLPPDAVRQISAATRELSAQVEAICIRDGEGTDWPEALCRAAIEVGHQEETPVLISPAAGADWQRYRGASVLTPNRQKTVAALGSDDAQASRLGELARPVVRQLRLQALVATLDREGALVIPAEGQPVQVPTRARSVYDITGAGDVMLAVLAAASASGAAWPDAVRLANAAAGLSVERFGPVTISPDELNADVALEGHARAGKLRTLEELMAELAPRRAAGAKVVFTNGCFDILHAGHIQYFKYCQGEGDIVVVGMNSDASVRAQNKGDDRPINNQIDRARMLSALEDIDYVVIFDEPTPETVIRRILPDVLVKGADWAKWVCGREVVEANGGKVVLAPMMHGYSTSELLSRIRGMEERREGTD